MVYRFQLKYLKNKKLKKNFCFNSDNLLKSGPPKQADIAMLGNPLRAENTSAIKSNKLKLQAES